MINDKKSPSHAHPLGAFPTIRPRRLRQSAWSRALYQETILSPSDLIWPVFIQEGTDIKTEIESMPGVYRLTLDALIPKALEAASLGIPAIALFPYVDPVLKSKQAHHAWDDESLVCRAVALLKKEVPDIGVMTDVALDPYTDTGHDGIVINGKIDNDASIDALVKQALSHARAGADIVAPSDMMDGRIGAVRMALEENGFKDTLIMAYSAKYASAYYGPFREAVGAISGLGKQGKKTYQLSPTNSQEALHEIAMDWQEGADMVMVKPGQAYLDILCQAKQQFQRPTYVYHVSGEYAMIKAAVEKGWLDEKETCLEALMAFKRAGADGILTYYAMDAARWLSEDK